MNYQNIKLRPETKTKLDEIKEEMATNIEVLKPLDISYNAIVELLVKVYRDNGN